MNSLPKIKHSVYKHKLKGIDKEISFRPYTNAEQKILLLAKEEGKDDEERMLDAIVQILNKCIVDKIDVYDLPMFDIEDIFVRIRAKSVGEIIPVKFKYNYTDENGATKTDFVTTKVNIDDIKVEGDFSKESRTIMVDDMNKIGIKLRHPTLRDIKELNGSQEDEDLLKRCIEVIFDENEVYDPRQVPDEEYEAFVDDIEGIEMLRIKKFFDAMPKLIYQTEIYKKHLDETETVTIKGLDGFFS